MVTGSMVTMGIGDKEHGNHGNGGMVTWTMVTKGVGMGSMVAMGMGGTMVTMGMWMGTWLDTGPEQRQGSLA